MKVSIVSFGCSESAKYIYNQMKENEINIEYCLAIEQTKEKIAQVSAFAEENSDLVFYIGGLGLSANDVLKETLAERYGADIVINQKTCDLFANYIKESKSAIPPEHVQQRLLCFPDGFDCYQSKSCYELSASGRFFGKDIFLLPDDIKETKYIFSTYIQSYLSKKVQPKKSFVYKVFGLTKDEIEEKLAVICKKGGKYFVETDVANDSKIVVRFDAKTSQSVMDEANLAITKEFAEYLYAVDDFSLNQVAVDLLKLYKRKLSVAESLTGGEIVAGIVDVPGASEVLFEGCTTYANGAKNKRLHVKNKTLADFGAVSRETAYQMAIGLLETSECDVVLATTGIAGPGGGSAQKPVGLTFISVGDSNGIHIHKYVFSGDRNQVRQKAAKTAIFLLIKLIKLRK